MSVRDLAKDHPSLFVAVSRREFADKTTFRHFLEFFVEKERESLIPPKGSRRANLCSFLNEDEIVDLLGKLGIKNSRDMKAACPSIGEYLNTHVPVRVAVFTRLGWSSFRQQLRLASLEKLLASIHLLAETGQADRESIMKSLRGTHTLHQHPDWREPVMSTLSECFPKKPIAPKTVWTKEKVDAAIALANETCQSLSEVKTRMRPLYDYLKRRGRLNELANRKAAPIKESGTSREVALSKKRDVKHAAQIISNRHRELGLYPMVYALLSGGLPNELEYYTCDVERLKLLRDILEISSWADCQANFPALFELLTWRAMGSHARLLWPDAPAARLPLPEWREKIDSVVDSLGSGSKRPAA